MPRTEPRTDLARRALAAALALTLSVPLAVPAMAETVHTIGHVTWHPTGYVNQIVSMKGYLLKVEKGYVILSDEAGGGISVHDLPVTGPGWDVFLPGKLYLIHGKFVKGGLNASNHDPYHLILTQIPKLLSH